MTGPLQAASTKALLMSDSLSLFPGFRAVHQEVDGALVNAIIGGNGPPLLLLHGYPQTHEAWHLVAPTLARDYTVVAADIRGYGKSRAPQMAGVEAYAKSAMALDQVGLMRALGFQRFAVVGHDRGARVAYRMALDHPSRVSAFASLTVYPTLEMWERAGKAFGMSAYHWYMLAQPEPLPEALIGANPDFFLDYTLRRMAGADAVLHPKAVESYKEAFRDPDVRHAICQDYRAGATIDVAEDKYDRDAGRKLACPVLILWTDKQLVGGTGETPLDIWRRWASDVSGASIGSGHLLAETAPFAVLDLLSPFLSRHAHDHRCV